jgi:hypothetical protein
MRRLLLVAIAGCGSAARPTTAIKDREPDHASEAQPAQAAVEPVVAVGMESSPGIASGNRCDNLSDLSIDGLLDDWKDSHAITRIGSPRDGSIELRCAWDGAMLGLAFNISDDRVIRVKGGHEDHVTVKLRAGARPVEIIVYPGNAMARSKIVKPAKASVADSLQPNGYSVEIGIPAAAIPGFSSATSAFELEAELLDSDAAMGGDDTPLRIAQNLELSDRRDLFDDFLTAVKLGRGDIRVDLAVDLDPDRPGKERLVSGGTVIGVITDQYAYVTLPAASAAAVKSVAPLALGARGQHVVAAQIRQEDSGGGARELLMLWTVWSGQLQPLANIEIKKQLGANVLEASWKLVKGRKGPELVVEPLPAIGFTAETWGEVPAGDVDSIVLPWDTKKGGTAYSLEGAEIRRRDLPPKKKR